MSLFRSQNFTNVPPAQLGPQFPNSTDYMTNYTVASIAGDYQAGVFSSVFAASGGYIGYATPLYAWKAFDDVDTINSNVYTASGGVYLNTMNNYLAMKFPQAWIYKHVQIYCMQDGSYWYHPRIFDIRGSNNGSSWTTVSSVNRGTTGWSQHSYTFDFTGNETAYQYWGLYITGAGYTLKSGGSATTGTDCLIHRVIWKSS